MQVRGANVPEGALILLSVELVAVTAWISAQAPDTHLGGQQELRET